MLKSTEATFKIALTVILTTIILQSNMPDGIIKLKLGKHTQEEPCHVVDVELSVNCAHANINMPHLVKKLSVNLDIHMLSFVLCLSVLVLQDGFF